MSGGNKNLIINSRERAISSDFNRLQAFAAADRASLLRYQLSPARTTPLGLELPMLEQGGYADTSTLQPIGTPVVADVFEGLVVLPQAGTLNLLVSPGAVGLLDPDGQTGSSDPTPPTTDDSPYKVVVDPGIQVAGALTIAAGAGSTRIDLVECRRQTVVLETDSRDQFDPSTGVFVPVAMNKVAAGRLIYRVTQGAPGGGIPARSQGWLPLCVVSVPSSATAVDTMTFWDVRPLIRDRVVNGEAQKFFASLDPDFGLYADDHSGTATLITGVARSNVGMYKAGGYLASYDARAAANHASGYAPANGSPWYLYAVFPANLPRWVKYSSTPPLVPSGPLGVISVSSVGPPGPEPAVTLINPPTSTGLVTAGPAALLAAGSYSGGVEHGFVGTRGGLVRFTNGNAVAFSPTTVAGATDYYTLTANTHFPRGAKSLLIEVDTTFNGASTSDPVVSVPTVFTLRTAGGQEIIPHLVQGGNWTMPSTHTVLIEFLVEVDLVPYPTETGIIDCFLEVGWSDITSRGSSHVRIYGWRF